jgi:hypothetical protein
MGDPVSDARECLKSVDEARGELKELSKLLEGVTQGGANATHQRKILDASDRLRRTNERVDECIKNNFNKKSARQ